MLTCHFRNFGVIYFLGESGTEGNQNITVCIIMSDLKIIVPQTGKISTVPRPLCRPFVMELVLRTTAAVACLVAMVVMITNKQTKVIPLPGFGVSITSTAKYNLSEVFVYLVSASGIGAAYSLALVLLSILTRDRPSGGSRMSWLILVLDKLVTYVLLAAAAASTELLFFGSHASPPWFRVCSVFGRFCNLIGVSLAFSFIAVIMFGVCIVVSAYHVFSRSHKGTSVLAVD